MYDNTYLASLLDEIATLLEMKGENIFKIRALRMAAANIREYTIPLAKIANLEELMKIQGIGKSIAEKLLEIIQTGDCDAHQDLVKEFPRELLDLLNIEGLGPKRVAALYKKLKITTPHQLKEAAEKGEIEKLEGFGSKTVEKILKSLERFSEKKERFTLDRVVPVANEIVRALREIPGIDRVEIAGSLRRWKETVKDLDILVTGSKDKAKEVMDVFTSLLYVTDVVVRGDTKTTVKLNIGIQVDLRFVESNCFGASMQYFTGSKEHNIALRTFAKDKGFKTSEYGLFDVSQGQEIKVAGEDEVGFYGKLGMAYIEPDLRENAGEIEAALQGNLPNLITLADIQGDLQMHTVESDGKHTLRQMVEGAIALGYSYIAITDHSKAMHIAHGMDEERLLRCIEAIHKINAEYPSFHVLAGVEVDILKDGSLDLDENVLEECDVVVASIHSSLRLPAEEMTKRIIDGISHKVVHILAHPTARLIQERDPIEYDFDKVVEAAIANQVALEVNSYPTRLDLKDTLARRVLEKKGILSINTDAHAVEHLKFMELGVHTARRGWCRKEDCINTFSLGELKIFLSKRKLTSLSQETPPKKRRGRKKIS